MRNTVYTMILAALFLAAAGCSKYDKELLGEPQPEPVVQTEESPPPPETEDVGQFDELRYYGQWYETDEFGWGWRPTVVSEWRPFTRGHWIWSQYGWMWVDYDPWGWATAHYGYWTHDFALGWIWIPDYTWSPCQCDWYQYDDWIGWAPLPPPGARFKDPWEDNDTWVSVPVRRFKEANVGSYRDQPKFKTASEQNVSRSKPDVREIARKGPTFRQVEVQLERRTVGSKEFAKVIYPPEQERIIQSERVAIKTPIQRQPVVGPAQPLPPPATGNGGTVDNSKPKTDAKAKPTEKKYKGRRDDDKKDDGKSKDESTSGKKKG